MRKSRGKKPEMTGSVRKMCKSVDTSNWLQPGKTGFKLDNMRITIRMHQLTKFQQW